MSEGIHSFTFPDTPAAVPPGARQSAGLYTWFFQGVAIGSHLKKQGGRGKVQVIVAVAEENRRVGRDNAVRPVAQLGGKTEIFLPAGDAQRAVIITGR